MPSESDMERKKPFWLGGLLAPPIAPLLFFVGTMALMLIGEGSLPPDMTLAAVLFFGFGLPVSYAATWIFGVPLVLLLKKSGHLSIFSVCVGGAIGGSITLATFLFVRNMWAHTFQSAAIGAVLGVSVAFIFCAVTGITNSSNRSLRSGAPV